MGMTDMQFKTFIREFLANLEEIKEECPENEKLKKLITRLTQALQD